MRGITWIGFLTIIKINNILKTCRRNNTAQKEWRIPVKSTAKYNMSRRTVTLSSKHIELFLVKLFVLTSSYNCFL